MAQEGWLHRYIAEALKVSAGAANRWITLEVQGGPGVLRSHSSAGPPRKLTSVQLRMIPDFLWQGAEAYGFKGQIWTCQRAAGVLFEEFAISNSKSQVW